ncbi:hypothetical protein JADG_009803 [Aureobasidium aubasidani]|nr:hypothetical protein JADG_009803 [Aureobasidium pullulans]
MAEAGHVSNTYHNPGATHGATQINGNIYYNQGQDLLERLHVAPEASHNSAEHEDDPRCLEETRTQLKQDIYSWQDSKDDDRCIFWLSGMAGTGKSTIARTVADEFEKRGCLIASFFFSRGSGDSASASLLFTSLAKQLATWMPPTSQAATATPAREALDSQHSQSRLQAVLNHTASHVEGHTIALDEMYLTVLNNAFKNQSQLSESERERSRDLYDHIIGTIIVSQEDLSVETLAHLTQVTQSDIIALLEKLRSIIKRTGTETPITLLHETFREFISDVRRCTKDYLAVDTKTAHRRTFNDCLRVLSAHLKQDLRDLKDPGIAVDDPRVDSAKILDSLPLHVQYAVCHWTIHLECGGIDATDLCATDTFLHKHLLHWVEAMSWLNKYAEAVESISRLYELLVIYDKA